MDIFTLQITHIKLTEVEFSICNYKCSIYNEPI